MATHKLPLVSVVWKDAWVRADEPVNLEDVAASHKPTIVTTIGWLLLQDGEGVSLANEFYDSTYRGRTFIYHPMIVSVTPFKMQKSRPRKHRPPVEPDSPANPV